MRENIKNEHLIKRILKALNKFDFEDVTEKDLESIENISLSSRLVNGDKTGICVRDIDLFPFLKSVTFREYVFTMEDMEHISEKENIENISFVGCEFKDVDFNCLLGSSKCLRFSRCTKLPEKFPSVKRVIVDYSEIDFNSINLSEASSLNIKFSNINNAHNIDEYKNILEVNLDGSRLFDFNGNEIQDISVAKNTLYSHEKEKRYETTSNDIIKLNKEKDETVYLER